MRADRLPRRLAQGHVQNVDFGDAQALIAGLGFRIDRVSGSHHIYIHPDIESPLNLQDVRGQAKPYQLRQLTAAG